jgi:tryptophan-rich sensory protein
MAAGIAASIALAWRKTTAAGIAAALFGLSLLVVVFGDPWSYTRLSAPMFAGLLLGGLQQRSRAALLICAAAAAMTLLMPFAPWLAAA